MSTDKGSLLPLSHKGLIFCIKFSTCKFDSENWGCKKFDFIKDFASLARPMLRPVNKVNVGLGICSGVLLFCYICCYIVGPVNHGNHFLKRLWITLLLQLTECQPYSCLPYLCNEYKP